MKDQSKVRLVDVKVRSQYLAFSYRWGKSQRLVTTVKNLPQMREGINLDRSSRAIQDAVLICRKLKIRYLWVDALCIIQEGDDYADWSGESQKMGSFMPRLTQLLQPHLRKIQMNHFFSHQEFLLWKLRSENLSHQNQTEHSYSPKSTASLKKIMKSRHIKIRLPEEVG